MVRFAVPGPRRFPSDGDTGEWVPRPLSLEHRAGIADVRARASLDRTERLDPAGIDGLDHTGTDGLDLTGTDGVDPARVPNNGANGDGEWYGHQFLRSESLCQSLVNSLGLPTGLGLRGILGRRGRLGSQAGAKGKS